MSALIKSTRAEFMSVAVGPGWILLTVMERGARAIAARRTSPVSADFVIVYTLAPGKAVRIAVLLPIVMMRPPSFISLAAAWIPTKAARTFTASIWSKYSSVN